MQGAAGLKRLIWHRLAFLPTAKKSAAIRAYSKQHAAEVRPWLPPRYIPTVEIPEGIDARLLPPPDWSPSAGNPKRFGFLGRLAPHAKGLDVLLRAWRMSGAHQHGAELHIRGHDTPAFRALLESEWRGDLPEGVLLGGPAEGVEKWDFLSSLGLFVHPSRHEGVPRVIREAVACGRPLLVTPQTNFGDLVTQTGCGVVTEVSEAELAAALARFACHPDELGPLTQRVPVLHSQLDWASIATRYRDLFRDVLRDKSAAKSPGH
jgi:glycosyltransferase involved in cell wall biosynthesis